MIAASMLIGAMAGLVFGAILYTENVIYGTAIMVAVAGVFWVWIMEHSKGDE